MLKLKETVHSHLCRGAPMTYVARIKWKSHVPFNVIISAMQRIPGRTAYVSEGGRVWRVYRI